MDILKIPSSFKCLTWLEDSNRRRQSEFFKLTFDLSLHASFKPLELKNAALADNIFKNVSSIRNRTFRNTLLE